MSSNKAILIIGGSGFVGTHLALRLRENYKVFATYYKHPIQIPGVGYFPMQLSYENWVKRLLYTTKPDVIIFCAGHEAIERAERNRREIDSIHVEGAGLLAKTTELFAPKFIYISSCYVFDGTYGNYRESDTPLPTTAFGKAKANGENLIRSKCLNSIIIRCSPLYGRGNSFNPSFLDQLRSKLEKREKIELNHETLHSFSPIHSLTQLVERAVSSSTKNRYFHVGGLTKTTYFEFAQEFAKKFSYDPSLILPKRTVHKTESQNIDPSFLWDYSLNSSQTIEALKIKPFLLEEGLNLI